MNATSILYDVIKRLELAKIHFILLRTRSDAVTVLATVPGERWEIEVFADGEVEIERFASQGVVSADSVLDSLIGTFGEPEAREE